MPRYMCQEATRGSSSDANISLSLSLSRLAVCGPARGSSFTNHLAESKVNIDWDYSINGETRTVVLASHQLASLGIDCSKDCEVLCRR